MAPPVGFSGRLRWAREVAGISARELAALADVTVSLPAKIERGERDNTELRTALALAAALGVCPCWLTIGKGPAPARAAIRRAVTKARGRAA